MPHPESTWAADLGRFFNQMVRLCSRAAPGSMALGIPEWDWRLWCIGREWMMANADAVDAARTSGLDSAVHRSDVYLATQVYADGGHTALIGDFIRALDGPSAPGGREGADSHLILTDLFQLNTSTIPDAIRSRLGLPGDHITVLPGPSLLDRVDQLFARLLALRPQRLFLFHHPDDPLASVVAHPEIARQCVLVHHADRTPSFGTYLPGLQIIDLTPSAAALTRLLGRVSAWLPLTAPDPGPRPHGFLKQGRLVTATSGSAHKFSSEYVFGYAETVGVILRATGGWHVHIGPLEGPLRLQIDEALRRKHVPGDRFIHVPWTPSVTSTLWTHECDLYCASFPIDGARTKVEVMASATPYLRHSTRLDGEWPPVDPTAADGLVWRTFGDLSTTLQRMANATALEEQSALMRAAYEDAHHPRVFVRHLAQILNGGGGRDDPDWRDRADRTAAAMLRSLVHHFSRLWAEEDRSHQAPASWEVPPSA